MMKTFFPVKVFFFIMLTVTVGFASAVPIEWASNVVEMFLGIHPEFVLDAGDNHGYSLREIAPLQNSDGEILAYIAHLAPIGYIAVSSDTDIEPIIAFSTEGDFVFDESQINIPQRMLETDMQLRREAKPFIDASVIRANNIAWQSYLNRDKNYLASVSLTTRWGPLLDTNWGQGPPYNTYCPMDPEAGERAVVGCVATAMSQIVDYWEWPSSVHFYPTDSYWSEYTTPRIWIDATTANVSSIDYRGAGRYPDTETIARLMFACGVSVEMQYSLEGSGSDTRHVPGALLSRFAYASASGITIMTTGFYDTLKTNIFKAQPVELGIGGWGVGGHAIVVDGYDSADLYHLDMGWSGYANGWYSLPSGMPEGFTIVGHQAMNIIPPVITRRPVKNLTGKSVTGGSIELRWGVPFNITEPIVQYKIYRKRMSESSFTFIASTLDTVFMDDDFEELTGYTYGVSADYVAGESDIVEVSLYSGIIGGWSRTFGSVGDQVPYSVAPTPEFGCIAVGYSQLSGSVDTDAFVVRTVAGGSRVWSATYDNGGSDDCFHSVVNVSDSFYVVSGYTKSSGVSDIWLVKLDDSGDTVWTSVIGTSADEVSLSHIETVDGGFMLAGYHSQGGIETGLVVKTDSYGNEIWTKKYLPNTRFNSISKVADGGFIVAGNKKPGSLGNSDAHIVRIDSAGDTLWSRDFGGTFDDMANSIVETQDGNFAFAGKTKSYGMPLFFSMLIIKITPEGDEIWARTFVEMGDFEANSINNRINGNIVSAGSGRFSGNVDAYTVELTLDGDTVETRRFGTDGSDVAYSAIELADTGLVIACRTFESSGNNFWLIKLGGDLWTKVSEPRTELPHFITISAYPNPFNSAVNIKAPAGAEIEILDIAGRRIDVIPDLDRESRGAGGELDSRFHGNDRMVVWSPDESLPSGVYLLRVRASNGSTASKRVIYLK